MNLEKKTKEIVGKYNRIKLFLPKGNNINPLGIAQMVNQSEIYSLNEEKLAGTFVEIKKLTKISQGINDVVNADLSTYHLISNDNLFEVVNNYNSVLNFIKYWNKFAKGEEKYLTSSVILYDLKINNLVSVYDDIKKVVVKGRIPAKSPIVGLMTIGRLRDHSSIENLTKGYHEISKKSLGESIDLFSRTRMSITLNRYRLINNDIFKSYNLIKKHSDISKNARAILVEALFTGE